jgi:hypothetical protein
MPRAISPQAAVAFDEEPSLAEAPVVEAAPAPAGQAMPQVAAADDDSDASLISRFEQMVRVPEHLEDWYRRFQEDRDYVNELCMLLDDQDTVATNYVLRNQYVLMSQLHNSDPDISIVPRDLLKLTPPPIMLPGPMGMPMPMPGMMPPPAPGDIVAPGAAPGPDQEMQSLALFGATAERVIKHYLDQASARRVFDGILQDTFTCGIAWLKVVYQEDFARDALGNIRQDDQQIKFAQYRYLRELFDASLIDENCPEYKEMVDVNNTIKAYLTGQIEDDLKMNPPDAGGPMQGPDGMPMPPGPDGMMPMAPVDPRIAHLESLANDGWVPLEEVPDPGRFRGFVLEQVMPEDLRHDWNVMRPEEIHIMGEWMAQRVFMLREQFGRKFQVTPEEMLEPLAMDGSGNPVGANRHTAKGNSTEAPGDRSDLEATKNGDRVAVWEFQNKKTGRVYVWAMGMKRFVRNYVPVVRPKNFFTIFPFYFNRVSGRVLPLSDVRLQMSQQDEINLLRTHEREARRACYPKIIVGKGLFLKGEKAKLENAMPYAVIEMQRATDIAKSLHEVQPPTFHAELYDVSKAIRELEIMAGIPQSAMGTMAGADSATEAAISNERMGEQADRRRAMFEAFIHDIAWCIGEMAVEVIDPDTAIKIAGKGGFWPYIDRSKLFNMLQLKVRAGSSGKPDAGKQLEFCGKIIDMATATGQVAQLNLRGLLEEVMKVSGVYLNLDKILPPLPSMAPLGGQPPLPGLPGMPAPGGAPAGDPLAGPGPGAPPMMTPRPPEKIPGSPAAALAKARPT